MDYNPARERTACFTGHRPQRLPWRFNEADERHLDLISRLRDAVERSLDEGYNIFVSGGAIGVDMWAAEQVLALKASRPILRLHVVVPCAGQEHNWPGQTQARYYGILSRADDVEVLRQSYAKGCMAVRNRRMVDMSSRLIAVYDGVSPGGTQQTISMAERAGLDIITLGV